MVTFDPATCAEASVYSCNFKMNSSMASINTVPRLQIRTILVNLSLYWPQPTSFRVPGVAVGMSVLLLVWQVTPAPTYSL